MSELKPGMVVKAVSKESWRNQISVLFLDNFNSLREGKFPNKKPIPSGTIGFVVALPDAKKDKIFDWLVEVSFPGINVQGWVSKRNVVLVNL